MATDDDPRLTRCTGGTCRHRQRPVGARPAATAPSTSAGRPATSRPIRRRSRSSPATRTTEGATGRRRQPWRRVGEATSSRRSPPARRLRRHAYMTWANFLPDEAPPPWTNTVAVLAHDRRRRHLVAPRPRRPGQPVRHRPGTEDPRAAERDAAGDLRPRRLGDRPGDPPGRALARRGTHVATRRWRPARSRFRLESPPVDPETGEHAAPAGLSQLGGRARRHRLRRLRGQPVRRRSGAIGVLRSRDGGVTWSSSPLPGVTAFAFEPAIAVDRHGTVGVIWYDLRNDRPGDGATTADVWFASSDDHGAILATRSTSPAPPICGPARPMCSTGSASTRGWPAAEWVRRRLRPGGAAGHERPDRHLLRADRPWPQ